MKITKEHEEDLTLPEDSIHRAKLTEIELREFTFTDRKTGKDKAASNLEWWWEITATDLGPQYIGRRVKGECPAKFSDRDGNKFNNWAEALLGREIPIGMDVDTDELVGLEADIVIGHRADRKEPTRKWEFVSDIAPTDGSSLEPPF